ncbi:MAG: tRNA (adenosine(37)-N6)-dimethylallyltransferase MiaA [Candidatus Doudnabacteria bacterium]|nr:tRNA (adenosine(37)-N6)-dimethylallyltransferase MiaA [Candidatus Doudnabacteria bacterium]
MPDWQLSKVTKNKLIVILGPTSSGKSALAIALAKKFNGEIISADSRQVYKGMDLGTGKVTKKEQKTIPHHLLDVASPKRQFTVAEYQSYVKSAIAQITYNEKVPFLVGGTPFYIYAVIDDLQIPEVKPNLKLRKQLEKKSAAELFKILKKLDPRRAKNIDPHNPRRLIRAIEIIKATGQPIPLLRNPELDSGSPDALLLGIKKNPEELKKLIKARLEKRLKQGMVKEIKKLLKQGVSHKRLFELGLEYRYVSEYLKRSLSYQEMKDQLLSAIVKFSKRQMTWFKTDKRIHWIRNQVQAEQLIRKLLF